ncbi:hypothetical protein JWG45_04775 [Leptospira sp. 201903070]|uniref:Flagellar assembly protein FlaA n=1 Tax=Leptospira ainlahdjerensis TaxID=2810033 RepID=A0ABS2U7X7_9LEPT|nr:hypothetical protein [Leptospira ainlahdjerensis]MBM9576464.1 hypothetical protein [Leptospira ainlahdjerensis]
MRILILSFFTCGILIAQDFGLQEDINTGYKRMAREKKKVIIPEIVGLKPEDQKKLFDRSSKTYVEFPILSGNKPTIVIKTPRNQEYSTRWWVVGCTDLGKKFNLKYLNIKKMKLMTKVIFKNEQVDILREDNMKFDSEGIDLMSFSADNDSAFNGNPSQGKVFFKYFLIEIYIEDVFRKENKNLCISEILPFDS